MEKYGDFRPTAFDCNIEIEDRSEWSVLPCSITRDSEVLARSNFEVALERIGGESSSVEVHRIGHWGPGWYEIAIVDPHSPAHDIAEKIEAELENYPVLSEEHYSNLELEEFNEHWRYYSGEYVAALLDRHGDDLLYYYSEELAEIPADDREYFIDNLLCHDDSTLYALFMESNPHGTSDVDVEVVARKTNIDALTGAFDPHVEAVLVEWRTSSLLKSLAAMPNYLTSVLAEWLGNLREGSALHAGVLALHDRAVKA
jgi:hypothetical protein